jgi:predicted kinase
MISAKPAPPAGGVPTLHLLCGKIASGKSTLARELGSAPTTVVLSEDEWLSALYADEMSSLADYVQCAAKLRQAIGPHVLSLLGAGMTVVLDFPANTRASRQWLREIIEGSKAAHILHVLEVPDEVCRARLRRRNESGAHPFTVTDEQFDEITGHYEPPTADEGFGIRRHSTVQRED